MMLECWERLDNPKPQGQERRMRFLLLALVIPFLACSKTSASGARAELIPAPVLGVQCFIVRDENSTAVGGGCVKD